MQSKENTSASSNNGLSSGSSPDPCESSRKPSEFQRDVEWTHSCSYCSRTFSTSQALGGHQNAHRREREDGRRESYAKRHAYRPHASHRLSLFPHGMGHGFERSAAPMIGPGIGYGPAAGYGYGAVRGFAPGLGHCAPGSGPVSGNVSVPLERGYGQGHSFGVARPQIPGPSPYYCFPYPASVQRISEENLLQEWNSVVVRQDGRSEGASEVNSSTRNLNGNDSGGEVNSKRLDLTLRL